MTRGLRLVTVAVLMALLAQGAWAAESEGSSSMFDSVVQVLTSIFTDSGPSMNAGDEPELGPIPIPIG